MYILLVICVAFLSTTTSVVQGKFIYRPNIQGWLAHHQVAATWEDAYKHCRNEGDAVLASPITEEIFQEMRTLIRESGAGSSVEHYIGVNKKFYPGDKFLSIEGVHIDDMPVSTMITFLNNHDSDDCLVMNKDYLYLKSCDYRLPYFCYKNEKNNIITDEPCGKDYKHNLATGSCYKLHNESKTWDQAFITCAAEGGYLAIINDDLEAQFIHNITSHMPLPYVFIGLRDRDGTGDWISVHGQSVEQLYNEWIEGGKTATSNYKCCRIHNTGELDACTCTYARAFLCEKEPYDSAMFDRREMNYN